MGTHFRVAELAQLYGLNSDTLRYYEEQGLLHPRRGENRYREYSIADLCDLNIIRSLRELDVPVGEIRGYLGARTVGRTGEMLARQRQILEERMAALEEEYRAVQSRIARLERASELPVGAPAVRELPERYCLIIREKNVPEGDVDYLLKRLEHRHSGLLKDLGSRRMGAVIDAAALAEDRYDRYGAAFFLWECPGEETEPIPAGRYLTLVHAGGYGSIGESYRLLYASAAAMGERPADLPLELYHIDVHDTGDEREFLTELQVRLA